MYGTRMRLTISLLDEESNVSDARIRAGRHSARVPAQNGRSSPPSAAERPRETRVWTLDARRPMGRPMIEADCEASPRLLASSKRQASVKQDTYRQAARRRPFWTPTWGDTACCCPPHLCLRTVSQPSSMSRRPVRIAIWFLHVSRLHRLLQVPAACRPCVLLLACAGGLRGSASSQAARAQPSKSRSMQAAAVSADQPDSAHACIRCAGASLSLSRTFQLRSV